MIEKIIESVKIKDEDRIKELDEIIESFVGIPIKEIKLDQFWYCIKKYSENQNNEYYKEIYKEILINKYGLN